MKRLGGALRKTLALGGLELLQKSHPAARYVRHQPTNAFEDVLLRSFTHLDGLRFVQIGANDGQRADPIAHFIDQYQWSGAMYEPLAVNFAALQRRRGQSPGIQLHRAAVDLTTGQRTLYDLSENAKRLLPEWAGGLASFDRERLLNAIAGAGLDETAIVEESVPTVTWAEVWARHGTAPCDLLVLDTEGYDLPLLNAAHLEKNRPRIILFEHGDSPIPERLAMYGRLIALGYELATCEGDTVASLPPVK